MNTYKINVTMDVTIDAEKSSDAIAAILKSFGLSPHEFTKRTEYDSEYKGEGSIIDHKDFMLPSSQLKLKKLIVLSGKHK